MVQTPVLHDHAVNNERADIANAYELVHARARMSANAHAMHFATTCYDACCMALQRIAWMHMISRPNSRQSVKVACEEEDNIPSARTVRKCGGAFAIAPVQSVHSTALRRSDAILHKDMLSSRSTLHRPLVIPHCAVRQTNLISGQLDKL